MRWHNPVLEGTVFSLGFSLQLRVLCQELGACSGLDGANKSPPQLEVLSLGKLLNLQ